MKKRDRRQKASEVFRESDFMMATKTIVSFDDAYPEVEDIIVEFEEIGHGISQYSGKRIYNKERFPRQYINCSNPLCYNGGFDIGYILNEMVRKKQSELETSEYCQGYEGSPKGRRRYKDCMNSFEIKVSVKYKNQSDKEK